MATGASVPAALSSAINTGEKDTNIPKITKDSTRR